MSAKNELAERGVLRVRVFGFALLNSQVNAGHSGQNDVRHFVLSRFQGDRCGGILVRYARVVGDGISNVEGRLRGRVSLYDGTIFYGYAIKPVHSQRVYVPRCSPHHNVIAAVAKMAKVI